MPTVHIFVREKWQAMILDLIMFKAKTKGLILIISRMFRYLFKKKIFDLKISFNKNRLILQYLADLYI
jgi:hypothetical protein